MSSQALLPDPGLANLRCLPYPLSSRVIRDALAEDPAAWTEARG